MIPHNDSRTHPGISVRKRRARKKKPVILDPETERQERELRAKIKESLHTQQVLRTEVEEDESQQCSSNVASSLKIKCIDEVDVADNVNNPMMGWGVANGLGGMQPQMRGIQQPTNQFNYGFRQNQEMPFMDTGTNIPTVHQQQLLQLKQICQWTQHLEVQRQQLERQLQTKGQIQRTQGDDFEAALLNEDIVHRLKDEQEQLQESKMLDTMKKNLTKTKNADKQIRLEGSIHANEPQAISDLITPSPESRPRAMFKTPMPPETTLPFCEQGSQDVQLSHQSDHINQGDWRTDGQIQPLPYKQSTPLDQHIRGQTSQPLSQNEKRTLQMLDPRSSEGGKSLVLSNLTTDSWLKAGSLNSSNLAFHPVENMSASLNNSSFSGSVVDAPANCLDRLEGAEDKCNDANQGKGEKAVIKTSDRFERAINKCSNADPKNSQVSSGGVNSKIKEGEAANASIIRGLSCTNNKRTLKQSSLHPVQEKEVDENERRKSSLSSTGSLQSSLGFDSSLEFHSVGNRPASINNSSFLDTGVAGTKWSRSSGRSRSTGSLSSSFTQMSLSVREGEIVQSNLSMNDTPFESLHEMKMSMDSTAFKKILKQNQNGGMNISYRDLFNGSDSTVFNNLMNDNMGMSLTDFTDLSDSSSASGGTPVKKDRSDLARASENDKQQSTATVNKSTIERRAVADVVDNE